MTWIKTIPISQGDAALKDAVTMQHALYPAEYNGQVPGLPDDDMGGIVAAHTLMPEALKYAFATFGACMSPDLPLSRRQHEIIATVVSQRTVPIIAVFRTGSFCAVSRTTTPS